MTLTTEIVSKITASHLERDAYVYVRQSTLTQVREHTESLERQYELASRALTLGWSPRQVIVVDDDLGRSGADSTAREGFKNLVADVGLGKVGIIFGIEVSRLARNNADWYQLLDLCAVTDSLIADGDGLYHPADFNDRLVLGLKGTMSEAELHLIRHRLTAGLRHKAAKGELRQGLPVGFLYDESDHVVLDPDEAVIEAIATVFRRFDELSSARQVLMSLREDNLLIPRRKSGTHRVFWAPATYPAIHDFFDESQLRGCICLRSHAQRETHRQLGPPRNPDPTAAKRGVDCPHPRSPSRLCELGTLRADPRRASGELEGTARTWRRRRARGDSATPRHSALRTLWTHHASGLLGSDRRHSALSVRAAPDALWRRAGVSEHRRSTTRKSSPRRGLQSVGACEPRCHCQGPHRGRGQSQETPRRIRARCRARSHRGRPSTTTV
jgi:DNA invertase Pin-like site-specific DNA recombinase